MNCIIIFESNKTEKPEGRDHWEDQDVGGWIILKWILGRWHGMVWIGLMWLRITISRGLVNMV
jgi:hypothetical protein